MINTEIVLWPPLRFWHGATRGLNPALNIDLLYHSPTMINFDEDVDSINIVIDEQCDQSLFDQSDSEILTSHIS